MLSAPATATTVNLLVMDYLNAAGHDIQRSDVPEFPEISSHSAGDTPSTTLSNWRDRNSADLDPDARQLRRNAHAYDLGLRNANPCDRKT